MAARAELRARLSLEKSLFDKGIASAQAGAGKLSSGLASVGRIGALGFAKAGVALAALGGATGFALGIKGAFNLGSSLKELSSRTGVLPGKLLVLQRAFKDAGLEADDVGPAINRMQRFIANAAEKGDVKFGIDFSEFKNLKPEEQFEAIGKAINGITNQSEKVKAVMDIFGKSGGKLLDLFGDPRALTDAATAVGRQAAILNKNSELFDMIADKLSHAGTKLQGFFVGVAGGVANALAPILDKLDKADFSGLGLKLGASLVKGAQVLVGLFNNPQLLFGTLESYFRTAALGMGNVLIAAFKAGVEFFRDAFLNVLAGMGSAIVATLIEAFRGPIAYLQAGIEYALEFNTEGRNAKRRVSYLQGLISTAEDDAAKTKPGSGATASLTGASLENAEDYKSTMEAIAKWKKDLVVAQEALNKADKTGLETVESRAKTLMEQPGGPKFGLVGEGMTAEEWRKQSAEQSKEAINKAAQVAKNIQVPDVLGAGKALAEARQKTEVAAARGGPVMEDRIAHQDFISGGISFPKGSEVPRGIQQPPPPPKQETYKAEEDFIEGGTFYPKGSDVPLPPEPPNPQVGASGNIEDLRTQVQEPAAPAYAPTRVVATATRPEPRQPRLATRPAQALPPEEESAPMAQTGLSGTAERFANSRQTKAGGGVGAGAAASDNAGRFDEVGQWIGAKDESPGRYDKSGQWIPAKDDAAGSWSPKGLGLADQWIPAEKQKAAPRPDLSGAARGLPQADIPTLDRVTDSLGNVREVEQGLHSSGVGVGAGAAYNQSRNIWAPPTPPQAPGEAPQKDEGEKLTKAELDEVMQKYWGQ